jgi:hypothetical protein
MAWNFESLKKYIGCARARAWKEHGNTVNAWSSHAWGFFKKFESTK